MATRPLLPGWVADAELTELWRRVRARFERSGLVPQGSVRVPLTTRAQRQAAGALLGRTITRSAVIVDLATLDERLRERSGVGGLDVVLASLGGGLTDRPAARAARVEARERPLALATDLVDAPWGHEWVLGLRRSGLLTNRDGADAAVEAAVAVLRDLTDPARRIRPVSQSRVELGARVVGDAHALDLDRLVHQLVVRGLAAADGVEVPHARGAREDLWARFGVEPDLVSRTCLVWGLLGMGASSVARRLGEARDGGDPVHLTEWDLRRLDGVVAPSRVLVCENPRVLEAVAEQAVPGWVAVCTSGEPNLVVDAVLGRLAGDGADLRYHGDFDWPGVAIANRAIARYGVRPFGMGVDDYRAAVRARGVALAGAVVEPTWDAELGATMRSHGRVVHEESVLTELLDQMVSV